MFFFDDKKRDFLPVRDGADQGGGQERVMMNAVGGVNGIRRREEDNFDGTTTTLYTRKGRPVFETTEPVSTGVVNVKRGFLVKDPQSGYAVLFNPYDLSVLKRKYVPALNTYAVQHFGTRWNVPSTDTTHWNDVVLFDGTSVKVNARYMTALMTTADHGFAAVPFVIDTNDNESRYGSQELNTTQKRVFAVGRDQVKSWGGGGVTETLTPITPRADGRALTIGQRTSRTLNKAWFGQLFHTAMSWDDIGGGWGFSSDEVGMLLTAPYLSKVHSSSNVDMTPVVLASAGPPTSDTMDTTTTLPATPVAMTAVGHIESFLPYETGGCRATLHWDWSGTISKELEGYVHANYSRLRYMGEDNYSATQGGYAVTYSASNVKDWDNRSDITYISAQSFPLCDTHTDSLPGASLGATATTLYWDANCSYNTPETVPPTRGKFIRQILYGGSGGWTGGVPRDYETQTGTFTVTANSIEILFCEYYREHSTGQKEVFSPNTTYYDMYMGNYTYSGPSGMGMLGRVYLEPKVHPASDTIEIEGYKVNPNPPPHQLPEVEAEITQELQDMASALAGQTYYDDETSSGTHRLNFYYRSIANDVTQDTRRLTWRTKDYLLHDATNGVFISVEGSFSGSGYPATAALTVSLKVQTRYHTNTIALGEWSYTYGELLPETILDEDLGLWAVPSPQIRAIFAPLYQGQESFHGAHYVTASEEANGATPFHGVNFRLVLQSYDGFDECNTNNAASRDVYFVPCNLIEMLYCFVFSQEYGVNEYFKYPVTYADRFIALSEQLFKTYRISVRDGVVGNWTDTIDPKIASISNATLHRI